MFRLQVQNHDKQKRCMFYELCESFLQSTEVSVGIRKKGISDVLVGSVRILYEGAKARVRLNSELSEEFSVRGVHGKQCFITVACVGLWGLLHFRSCLREILSPSRFLPSIVSFSICSG